MRRSLFGYGTTTKPLAKSGNWDIYDDTFTCKNIDEFGNNLLPSNLFDPKTSSLEIPSPGFPPNHPLIQKANNLLSEYDYFFDLSPSSIWISGTNGKTTTAGMTQHLFEKIGSKVGGNYGTPLASLDTKAPLWILETSSFTFFYTKKAHPMLYALLPITPDHLNWHKNFKEYEESKLSVLKRMEKGSVAILPKQYKNYATKAFIVSYEDEADLAKYFNINKDALIFKEPFLLDALLALACEKILLGSISIEHLNAFKIDRHKMEEIYDTKDRLWVNDTKGTNDDATIAAAKRYQNKHIHLILGGVDKKLDNTKLFDFLATLPKLHIYAIGETAQNIQIEAKKRKLNVSLSHDIANAVQAINLVLDNNSSVGLLSPATSSFDQFNSYKHRGDFFIECVHKL